MTHKERLVLSVTAVITSALIIIWVFVIAPKLLSIPSDFRYQADIVSVDDFFDPAQNQFKGQKYSNTLFAYEATETKGKNLNIKNSFIVSSTEGKQIFKAEPLYMVNSETGKHVGSESYLFGPRNMFFGPVPEYTYRHVSADKIQARMKYSGTEYLYGLKVYRYETDYGGPIDQTETLSFLPDVSKTKGIKLESKNILWIEPITGHLVKQEDYSTDYYYYELSSGKKLNPYNRFFNRYTDESVRTHVEQAKSELNKHISITLVVPIILGLILFALLLLLSSYGDVIIGVVGYFKFEIVLFAFLMFLTLSLTAYTSERAIARLNSNLNIESNEVIRLLKNQINIYTGFGLKDGHEHAYQLPGVASIAFVDNKEKLLANVAIEDKYFKLAKDLAKTIYVSKPNGFYLINPSDEGYALMNFNFKLLFDTIVPQTFYDINVEIYEGLRTDTTSRIYTSNLAGANPDVLFSKSTTIFIGENVWTVVIHNKNNIKSLSEDKLFSKLIFLFGTIISITFTSLAYFILKSRNRALDLADKLTKDLTARINDLDKTNRLMIGRELKMAKLKEEIERLRNLKAFRENTI